MNIDKEFSAGLRVQHKTTKKTGTVQAEFEGGYDVRGLYEPWEMPVKWDGETAAEAIIDVNLIKLAA